MADLISRKKVDAVLVAIVGNYVGCFAGEKLQKSQIVQDSEMLKMHHRCFTIFGGSSVEEATEFHNAALRSLHTSISARGPTCRRE